MLHRVLTLLLVSGLSLLLMMGWGSPAQAQPLNLTLLTVNPAPLSALPGLGKLFRGETPSNLGIHNRQLTPCPASPNCVVSQNGDETHAIEPIVYKGDRKTAQQTLLKVLSVVPRTAVIAQTDDYIRAESTSRLLGFVDDLEFYFPEATKVIQVRSASRLGESDLGVNRRRLEQIRLASQDLGI